MENKWMLRAMLVLAVCLARHLTSGHGDRTPLDSNKTPHSTDPTQEKLGDTVKWSSVLLGVYTSWAIIKLVTCLSILHKNHGQFRRICCTSKTPTEERNPQSDVYEEVELRVNSICSSSEARPRTQTDTV
ncbi:hypothetical protein SRHO_G00105850 [Serrasalmus rhombeus]